MGENNAPDNPLQQPGSTQHAAVVGKASWAKRRGQSVVGKASWAKRRGQSKAAGDPPESGERLPSNTQSLIWRAEFSKRSANRKWQEKVTDGSTAGSNRPYGLKFRRKSVGFCQMATERFDELGNGYQPKRRDALRDGRSRLFSVLSSDFFCLLFYQGVG